MASILFEPATIKGIDLKNRFVRSATAEGWMFRPLRCYIEEPLIP